MSGSCWTDDVRNRVVWAEQPFMASQTKPSFTVHIANIQAPKASAFKTVGAFGKTDRRSTARYCYTRQHLSLP